MKEKIKAVMAHVFEVEISEITEEASPDVLPAWKSLNHIQLMAALEDKFDIMISEKDSLSLMSFRQVSDYIHKKLEE